ncbi:helix-turn-helix transcriptional regulator [Paenibacillus harenae]|uniref:helix-turn-helix transcriptional regulator n=1 Tax=Paenibacillus harenae TaxID=306543 RepID=UPI0003F934B9|nr:WYL domain-containing protein [Paenibacillus harenae]
MKQLYQAIKELRLVRFLYLDGKRTETERTIEPMGLFLKGYVWYIYGYCLTRSDIRVFRISRMLQLIRLPETFVRRQYSQQDVELQFMSRADFKRVRAVLRFNPEVKTRVRDEFGYDQIADNPDGTLTVNAYFSSMERAVQKILGYSSHVVVLEPAEVIAELQHHIRSLAQLYKV